MLITKLEEYLKSAIFQIEKMWEDPHFKFNYNEEFFEGKLMAYKDILNRMINNDN